MTGEIAGRVSVNCANGVSAAGRAGRIRVVLDIVLHVVRGRRISISLLVFKSPLMFARFDLAQVVDAGVLL